MRVRTIRVLIGAALVALAGAAFASVGINKSFTANSVSAGQLSTLTIVLLNPNAASATATAVTDTLPANVVVGTAPISNTCGGTVTATPGSGSVSLSGGTIPAAVGGTSGQCQFTASVLSNVPGTYIDTIAASTVSSSQGTNSQAAQATLVVAALSSITGTKTFAPTVVHGGGTASTMTIRLTNPNGVALTGAAFTDTFPANLVLATPPNLATTCAGGTVTGAGGGTTVQLTGGTIPANSFCTVTGAVITPDPTVSVNASRTNAIAANAVTTDQGVRNTAISGAITVQSGATVAKVFAPTTISSGGTSSLTITITNLNASALGGITLTDTFPGTMAVASPATASTTCGGTLTANPGDNNVNLTGGALGAAPSGAGGTSCTIKVNVTATNVGATAVTLTNSIPAGSFSGINYAAASGNLIVNPTSPITGTKTYSPGPVITGTTVATVTLTNNTASAATITSFTDNLTTAGAGFTVAASPAPGGTCASTITAPVGGTTVTATGGTIPAGASCTITFPIAIAGTVNSGAHTNTIAANGVQTTQGNNVLAISGPMDVARAFTATKTFSPATLQGGTKSTATITFTRNANAATLTNLSFTDTLPANHTVASPPNASTTCGGTLTASAGAPSFSLSGGSLTAFAPTCTVIVDVATPATAGSGTNTIAAGAVTTAQGPTNAAISATLTRVLTSVTINKSFTPATVAVGGTSQLAIQIRNNNANAIALSSLGLVDPFPIGMSVASPAGLAFTGSGCTFTAIGAGAALTLSGATVAANSICTLTVNVKATAAGNLINTLPVGLITDAQGVTNPAAAAATLASSGSANLTISKTDNVSTVTPGGSAVYTVSVANGGPNDVAGLVVNDSPAAGVTFTSWTCTASAGSQCTASGSGAIADTTTLLNGGTLTYTVNASFAAGLTGSTTNTASLGVPGSVVDTNPNTSASDTDTLAPMTALGVTKTDGATTYVPGLGATYTIVVTNNGPSDATDVTVDDTLPAGATLSASATCAASGSASCGTVSGATGDASFGASHAIVPAGGANQLTFTVPVSFAPGMAASSITNSVNVSDAPSGGSASASDTDTRAAQVALTASKSNGASTYTPGTTATYTVIVNNAGPSSAVDVSITDPLPAGVTLTGSPSCSASVGSSCGTLSGGAGDNGAGATGAAIAPGGSLMITLPVHYAAAMTAATITNTVGVSDAASGATASASDVDTRSGSVVLAISKTDGAATYTPGGSAVYTIVLTNDGPSDATSVDVTDALPAGLTLAAAVGCAATGNANCGTVTGAIGDTSFAGTGARVGAAPGDALTFTVPVRFAASLNTDPIVNTASAIDTPTGASAAASDADARSPDVSLAVAKSDGSGTYTPGGTGTYTVSVTNGGVSDAQDVSVTDTLPAGVVLTGSITCVASGNASCGAVSGGAGQSAFGATGARIGAGAGNAVEYSIPVSYDASLATDPLVNTANAVDVVSGATGSGSDSDARLATVTLAVAKSDGSPTYTPGGTATYTVTVTNTGASDALDVAIDDTLPNGVTLAGSATCSANGTASCGALSGIVGDTHFAASGAMIAAGGGNAVVLSAPVRFASALFDDPLVNTATATDRASGATGSGSDSDARATQVGLTLVKSDGSATYTPGGSAVYTIVAGNDGPTDADDVTISDTLPAGVTLASNVSCVASGVATCGTVAGNAGQGAFSASGASIAAGPGNTLTVNVPVSYAPSLTANPLTNAASAVDNASGASATASDSDALSAAVSLAVMVTDGSATYTPGGSAIYTITVTNGGISDALDVTIADTLPPDVVLDANVTCAASGTSSCGSVTGASGQSALAATGARVVPGAGNAVVLTVPVAFAPGLRASPLTDTASAVDLASGASGSGADADVPLAQSALSLTKTDGSATYLPGGTATYTLTVTNTGPSDATAVTVTDDLPAGVALTGAATCVAAGAASCGTLSGASGSSAVTLAGGAVAAGAGNALTISVPVRFAPSLVSDPLVNTASASADGGAPVPASDSDARALVSGLVITKSDGSASYAPGGTATYVITVTNAGPSDAGNVTIDDALPAGVTLATSAGCTASGAASCGTVSGLAGASAVGVTGASIAAGAGNALTLSVPVRFAPSLRANPLVNTARASGNGGVTVSASDSDVLGGQPVIAVDITDNATTYTPGATGIYVIRVTNTGLVDASGVSVVDNLPFGVTLFGAPACTTQGTATCGTIAGAIGGTAVTLSGGAIPAGAGNALVITLPVRFASTLTASVLVNSVSATASGAAAAIASDQNVRVAPPPTPAIPVNHPAALVLLVVAIALLRLARGRAGR